MKKRKAVYAGSFDPITNGHINVIERVSPLYDQLVILIAADPHKIYMFTPDERLTMVRNIMSYLPNVTVEVSAGGYSANYAQSIKAQTLIRGLRSLKGLDEEQTLATENRGICSNVETLWVPCLPDLMHVSSSMVRGHVGIDPSWIKQVARSVPIAVVAQLKKKYILEKAKAHWASLMNCLGNPKSSDEILQDLLNRYDEPHRVYHTLEHIVAMLDEFALTETNVGSSATEIKLAIWYHDVAYDIEPNSESEERSSRHAKWRMREMGVPAHSINSICEWIMMTTHNVEVPDTADFVRILLDLDLAILGKEEQLFDAYEDGIRREYSWVPEPAFRRVRSDILQSFLDRDSIYFTQEFRKKYEANARRNLQRSIDKLKGNL